MPSQPHRINSGLKKYSSLAAVFMLSAAGAKAQTNVIEYTDVDPDLSLNYSDAPYELDINNDSYPDFTISANKSTYYYSTLGYHIFFQINSVKMHPAEGNFIAGEYTGSSGSGYALPSVFNSGDLINSDLEGNRRRRNTLPDKRKYIYRQAFMDHIQPATGQAGLRINLLP